MSGENSKLLEEIGMMKAEELQQNNSKQSIAANQSSQQQMPEEKSIFDEFEEKMDAKSAELAGKYTIPNWLIETLKWPKRTEMADSKLSTSSWLFTILCWQKLHGNVQPHIAKHLTFSGERNESTGIHQAQLNLAKDYYYSIGKWLPFATRRERRKIPIACVPPPKYITGFEGISICFLNGQVMQFIESIHSKLNGISLRIQPIDPLICHSVEIFGQIHHLLEMLAKKAASFQTDNFYNFLRSNPNALGLIENVQRIIEYGPLNEEEVDLLVQWLIKSHPDQKPKFIEFERDHGFRIKTIDKIKEQFIDATQSANFIISMDSNYPIFSMENEQTEEVLALYHVEHPIPKQFLVRHQKGKQHLRAEWEFRIELPSYNRGMVDEFPVTVAIARIGEF